MGTSLAKHPLTSVHTTLPTGRASWLALDPRIMFDGAAVATVDSHVTEQLAQPKRKTLGDANIISRWHSRWPRSWPVAEALMLFTSSSHGAHAELPVGTPHPALESMNNHYAAELVSQYSS